jgi:SAM-dependent methyltransferase
MRSRLRRIHHSLPTPLKRVSSYGIDRARRTRRIARASSDFRFPLRLGWPDRRALAEEVYGWWWWRSLNRPRISDRTYEWLLAEIPAGSRGLDLGSRERVRADALTLDVVEADGVDVVADGHDLPFVDGSFDYVWCNAVLEHVRNPFGVAREIERVLRPGGLAVIQVPFLESIHNWPDDYFRFTQNGLRQLFSELDEVATGVSAGPGQVLPDLVQYYAVGFSDVHGGGLGVNLFLVLVGTLLWPIRVLDTLLRRRPSYWRWARAYYYVGRKPELPPSAERRRPVALYIVPSLLGGGFEEVMRLRTRASVQALQRAGADTSVIDVDAAVECDSAPSRAALAAEPDFAIAPNLNYYLAGGMGRSSVLRRADLPAALLWDDPLGALALFVAHGRTVKMGSVGERSDDPLPRFREIMLRPGTRHFSWDSGHIEAMTSLGLADPAAVEWYPIATMPPFLEQGAHPVDPIHDIAFCGNVYEAALGETNVIDDPFLASLTERVVGRKLANLSEPAWELLLDELSRVPAAELEERGLVPTSTSFWDYYVHLVWMAVTTRVRIDLLTAIPREVHVFGVFADPASATLLDARPNLVYSGNRSQFDELPGTFAATKVNVCLCNGLISRGVPSKFVDCVASGGFALVDDKADLQRLFGPAIDSVVFRNADEMNQKIEYFLDRPDERREIVADLRSVIERECTLERMYARVLAPYATAEVP